VFRSPKHNDPDEKEAIDHLIVHISQKGPPAATLRRFTLIWSDPLTTASDVGHPIEAKLSEPGLVMIPPQRLTVASGL